MNFFNALIHNTVFMSAVTGWFAAQVIKTVDVYKRQAIHQGQLRIADYIDAQKGKQLRQENIQRFQIADFKCSISIGKEKEQYEIQCNNQQMTVYIKTVMCFPCNMMIIIGEPVVRIKSSQHAQSNQPKRQNNQPLDLSLIHI